MTTITPPLHLDDIWPALRHEAIEAHRHEPKMTELVHAFVTDRLSFADALGYMLAQELAKIPFDAAQLRDIIAECHMHEPAIITAAQADLLAVMERDPAAKSLLVPFLFFKGFHALQIYRIMHWLWTHDQKIMACYIQSRLAECFSIDIHPAALIGKGILMDHAHGIVIGETAVVEDNVSMVHDVTLGGNGKEKGDRHPKIRTGVMIGAGAIILGNIEVGAGARVAAGSLVLKSVPAHKTVAGVPARVVGDATTASSPAADMNQMIGDEGSSI